MRTKENKEDKILNASIKVFSKKGYDMATIDEIARKAKVSKGIVFFYYKKKDNLIERAAIRSVPVDEITDLNRRNYNSPKELLTDFGMSFLKKYEDPDLRNLLLMTMATKERFKQIDSALRNMCFQEMDNVFLKLEELMKQRISAPIRKAFFGSLLCYVVWWKDNEMSPEDYVETLVDTYLNLMRVKN